MLDIFSGNILPQTFFMPLASENKDLYVDFMDFLISELKSEVVFKIDRERLRELLKDFILKNKSKYNKEILEEFEERINDHVLNIINVYLNNGWMEEEINMSGKRYITINPECINLFVFLNETKKSRNQFLTSSIQTIKLRLFSDDLNYALLIEAKNDCFQLKTDLKNLHSEYKTLIKDFVQNKKLDTLTQALISGFDSRCFRDYEKLKTRENFKKLKEEIIEKLFELYNDEDNVLTTIISTYIDEYESSELNPISESERKVIFDSLYKETSKMIENMRFFFLYDYDDIIKSIEKQREAYTSTALKQMNALKNDESMLSKIRNLIMHASSKGISLEELIYINETKILDLKSLKEYSKKETYKITDYIKEDTTTEAERKAITQQIKDECDSPYTMKKIVEIIEFYMKDKDELIISSIQVSSKKDLTILGTIPLYASDDKYKIIKLNERYKTQYGTIGNYKIIRRK